MDIEVAKILVEYEPDLRLRESYSGRGMYGKTTAGVVGEQYDFNRALAEVMRMGDQEEREMVAEFLENEYSQDNMGMDMIFY